MVAVLSSPLVQKNKQTFSAFNLLKILIKHSYFLNGMKTLNRPRPQGHRGFQAFKSLLFLAATINICQQVTRPEGVKHRQNLLVFTSVGPAYIMGEGKIATTVESGLRTPSSSTAACCFIRQCSGTSSSLVQPPSGWSSRTGRR